jgi:hypothetical protein
MVTRREQCVILERPRYLLPPRLLRQLPAYFPQHFDLMHLLFLSDNAFFQTRFFLDHLLIPLRLSNMSSHGHVFWGYVPIVTFDRAPR